VRFPMSFTRYKPAAGAQIALGGDTTPTGPPNVAKANELNGGNPILLSRFTSINGWPCSRVAVTYATTAATPVGLPATLWLWEERTGAWYQIGASVTLQPNQVNFFDSVGLLDMPMATKDNDGSSGEGSIAAYLLVTDPGAGANNGVYTFAMAPDLTTKGI
jgi:hypothetical protein